MTDLPEQGGAPLALPSTDPVVSTAPEIGRIEQQDNLQPQDQPGQAQPNELGKPPAGFVPQQAVHEARQQVDEWQRRAVALERQMAEARREIEALKPKPEAPDPWVDPAAYVRQQVESQVQPVQRAGEDMRENFSRMLAVDKFGEDAVMAAQRELESRVNQNPAAHRYVFDRIMRSQHPYGELVKWHKEQTALGKYGTDPEAYIKAEVERRIAEMTQQPGPQGQPVHQQQQLPQSFASARSNGPRTGGAVVNGPLPLSDIMGR